jgi:hypothetical protein
MKLLLFIILVLLLVPINLSEELNQEGEIAVSTIAKVYVNPPNFKVLDENSNEIFTVIKEAPQPSSYQGTLIKLKSSDLTDLAMAIKNLNTKKVILYKKDANLAGELKELAEIILI